MKHYYIIGVAVKTMTDGHDDIGKMFLKYKPIHITDEDIDNANKALKLSKDKIFKTSFHEAAQTYQIDNKSHILNMLQLSCRANNATLHCFILDDELDNAEEFFDNFVEVANIDNDFRQKLLAARI